MIKRNIAAVVGAATITTGAGFIAFGFGPAVADEGGTSMQKADNISPEERQAQEDFARAYRAKFYRCIAEKGFNVEQVPGGGWSVAVAGDRRGELANAEVDCQAATGVQKQDRPPGR